MVMWAGGWFGRITGALLAASLWCHVWPGRVDTQMAVDKFSTKY